MNLLLYLSPYSYKYKNVISSTLSWLCKENDYSFELYYESLRSGAAYGGPPAKYEDYFGSTILGGRHYEHYYKLNNLFKMKYAISNYHHTFRSSIPSSDIIINTDDISHFYKRVFSYFEEEIPSKAILIGRSNIPNFDLEPYCYPEIYFRKYLGLNSDISDDELLALREIGLKELHVLYLDNKYIEKYTKLGFKVIVLDQLIQDDDIKSVLTRITKRWFSLAEGYFFGDPVLTAHWIPWCCRNNFISIYGTDFTDLFINNEYNNEKKSNVVFGRQDSEDDIFRLSKVNLSFQIVDPCRPPFPILEKSNRKLIEPTHGPFDLEPSDEVLKKYADENKVLSSMLFWCPDLRHVECLYRLIDLITVTNVKVGVGITSYWYRYALDILQLLHIPLEMGGVFPLVEILLCSVGEGVASEGPGYMNFDTINNNIEKSKKIILEKVSEKFYPKGGYPFLDISYKSVKRPKLKPYFISRLRKPVNISNELYYKALYKNNFDYVISYKDIGLPKLVYRKDNFIAINFTAGQWNGVSPYATINNIDEYKKAEKKLLSRNKPGWVLSAIDSPLWLYSKEVWEKGFDLLTFFIYISSRNKKHDVINVLPHTIARYARIIDENNK